MRFFEKKILVFVAFLFVLIIGFFAFKGLNYNKIPKSAKLVLNLNHVKNYLKGRKT